MNRVSWLDGLRAFAIAGVLFMNIEAFALSVLSSGWNSAKLGPADRWAEALANGIFDAKAITLFAFLFGYGAAAASEREGYDRWRWVLALLVFGLLHNLLFFFGDILFTYGTMLAMLGPALRWPVRKIVVAGLIFLLPSLALNAVLGGFGGSGESLSLGVGAAAEYWIGRVVSSVLFLVLAPVIALTLLPFALFGVAARRAGTFDSERAARARDRVLPVLLPVALAANLVYPWLGAPWMGVLRAIATPLLAAAYLLLAWRFAGWFARFAPVGRMSLSIYLGTSIAASLLFAPYGANLLGRLGPIAAYGVAAALLAAAYLLATLAARRGGRGFFEGWLRRMGR